MPLALLHYREIEIETWWPTQNLLLKQTSRRIIPTDRYSKRCDSREKPLIIPVIAFAVAGEEALLSSALPAPVARPLVDGGEMALARVTQTAHLHIFDAQNQPEI